MASLTQRKIVQILDYAHGTHCGIEKRGLETIRSEEDLQYFLGKNNIDVNCLPDTNFEECMLILVFEGICSNGGTHIELRRLVEDEHTIYVEYVVSSPKFQGPIAGTGVAMMTTPFCAIVSQKSDKKIAPEDVSNN